MAALLLITVIRKYIYNGTFSTTTPNTHPPLVQRGGGETSLEGEYQMAERPKDPNLLLVSWPLKEK